MKKVIAIAIVVAVAFVGLTSYNGSGEKKEKGHLLAELTTNGGNQLSNGTGSKKTD
ncbi:MAG TPA: hypothetical protein VK183_08075 [Flavobacterium sp.]|nr:hypothetical protein [Flavobacterium sp.]